MTSPGALESDAQFYIFLFFFFQNCLSFRLFLNPQPSEHPRLTCSEECFPSPLTPAPPTSSPSPSTYRPALSLPSPPSCTSWSWPPLSLLFPSHSDLGGPSPGPQGMGTRLLAIAEVTGLVWFYSIVKESLSSLNNKAILEYLREIIFLRIS